jgi:hypothetical protein
MQMPQYLRKSRGSLSLAGENVMSAEGRPASPKRGADLREQSLTQLRMRKRVNTMR